MTISIQAQGLVKKGKAIKRNGASVGDLIYVSGNLGDAADALDFVLKEQHPASTDDNNISDLLN